MFSDTTSNQTMLLTDFPCYAPLYINSNKCLVEEEGGKDDMVDHFVLEHVGNYQFWLTDRHRYRPLSPVMVVGEIASYRPHQVCSVYTFGIQNYKQACLPQKSNFRDISRTKTKILGTNHNLIMMQRVFKK